ncbi:MAG: hypothetical protein JW888_08800 [Pirellulales bacterium]|nr:hypothetical protein [Pirellulales bacterium]
MSHDKLCIRIARNNITNQDVAARLVENTGPVAAANGFESAERQHFVGSERTTGYGERSRGLIDVVPDDRAERIGRVARVDVDRIVVIDLGVVRLRGDLKKGRIPSGEIDPIAGGNSIKVCLPDSRVRAHAGNEDRRHCQKKNLLSHEYSSIQLVDKK